MCFVLKVSTFSETGLSRLLCKTKLARSTNCPKEEESEETKRRVSVLTSYTRHMQDFWLVLGTVGGEGEYRVRDYVAWSQQNQLMCKKQKNKTNSCCCIFAITINSTEVDKHLVLPLGDKLSYCYSGCRSLSTEKNLCCHTGLGLHG